MKSLRLNQGSHPTHLILSFFFAILLHLSAFAQNPTVVVTPLPGNVYSIGVTNLNNSDLVFYRFSDGYHLTGMSTSTNPQGTVQRKFRQAFSSVSAFIARKNGPIDLAVGDILNPSCVTCLPPAVGLGQNEYVRLNLPSWDAFIEPAHPTSLFDTKTNPVYWTPELPWYFLPVTLKSPAANSRVFVQIPDGMQVRGAVVKGIYKDIFVSGLPFNINDIDIKGFNYPAVDRLFINMTSVVNNESNVYLILTSATELGDESTFESKMYDPNGSQWGPTSFQTVVTHQNPHDPNALTPSESADCVYEENNVALTYKVEFQNLGQGIADQVDVKIDLFDMILNPMAVQPNMISSKFPLTSFEKMTDKIIFHFLDINLPGLAADPQPPIEHTKGWVKVSVPIKNCAPELPPPHLFRTDASVTFFNHHNYFEETINTNQVVQHTDECNAGSIKCNGEADQLNDPNQFNGLQFTARCYPTLVYDDLFVQCKVGNDDTVVKVTITDINGKVWDKLEYQSMPDNLFQTSLDMSGRPAGMYIVHIDQGNNSAVSKVIKQ